MRITRIDNSNKQAFVTLLSDELFCKLEQPAFFALGVLDEADDGLWPAGALVFSVDEGLGGADILIAATVQWLYIAPEYRGKQMADRLMQAFWDVMDQSGIEHILCDVPMPEEYNALCAYLESWGFSFTLADRYEATLPLSAFDALPALRQPPRAAVLPLAQVAETAFRQFLRQILNQPGVIQELPQSVSGYETQLSCVCNGPAGIACALLVQQVCDGLLEIVLLRAVSAGQQHLGDLCRYALHAAQQCYPADTQVRLCCRTESSGKLIDALFPNIQPLLIRRGYYANAPQDQAEEHPAAHPDQPR